MIFMQFTLLRVIVLPLFLSVLPFHSFIVLLFSYFGHENIRKMPEGKNSRNRKRRRRADYDGVSAEMCNKYLFGYCQVAVEMDKITKRTTRTSSRQARSPACLLLDHVYSHLHRPLDHNRKYQPERQQEGAGTTSKPRRHPTSQDVTRFRWCSSPEYPPPNQGSQGAMQEEQMQISTMHFSDEGSLNECSSSSSSADYLPPRKKNRIPRGIRSDHDLRDTGLPKSYQPRPAKSPVQNGGSVDEEWNEMEMESSVSLNGSSQSAHATTSPSVALSERLAFLSPEDAESVVDSENNNSHPQDSVLSRTRSSHVEEFFKDCEKVCVRPRSGLYGVQLGWKVDSIDAVCLPISAQSQDSQPDLLIRYQRNSTGNVYIERVPASIAKKHVSAVHKTRITNLINAAHTISPDDTAYRILESDYIIL
ncbi:uncharacterized protein LOC129586546 isoform X2 [Paramacrobiotus metropolitanus]|uniref:uncharacterized protein LOC129586546 isoform X2 n=1 Tax=Paramacrobiotus metropolitanus TaxID=2943436 RepID=UPI0024458AF3|nr:uncharacterized protein LOC129586546 isoform X2 [Paramacrobiotus metropolitanus]